MKFLRILGLPSVLMALLTACGDTERSANDSLDCGTTREDASQVDTDATPRPPYILTFRVLPPSEEQGVHDVNINRVVPNGSIENHQGVPSHPRLRGGQYEYVTTQVQAESNQVVMEFNWQFEYNANGDTATTKLIDRDMTKNYVFRGRVEVTDQYHRTWVGYPMSRDHVRQLSILYTPGPCHADYVMRTDGFCIFE